MSHLICPLCGLNVPLSKFDPESVDLDIALVSFSGLGRGRGFKTNERLSIVGDKDITPRVAVKIVELCNYLLTNDVIDIASLPEELGISKAMPDNSEEKKLREENAALRKQLNATISQMQDNAAASDNVIQNLKKEKSGLNKTIREQMEELEGTESSLANIEESLEEIIETLEDYTGYTFDLSQNTRIEFIRESLGKVLEDVDALKAERDET